MISIEGLAYHYHGGEGIADISLTIARGESCSIIGPSGCGKSTLLHCLAGLLTPTSGSIATAAATGLVQQKDALFPWLTVADNLRLGARGRGLERAEPVLAELGVATLGHKFPGQLSGGER
ncbi:MAG TPA: ATP-binding cassette domain-containing protein, partial [Alkalispirochaeta sp.]|nr:ATP-binding cassette domain-containing protein [Alkalispirochaeta sp.]